MVPIIIFTTFIAILVKITDKSVKIKRKKYINAYELLLTTY